jgi:D-alanyl-D-alanine carboxypeptidase
VPVPLPTKHHSASAALDAALQPIVDELVMRRGVHHAVVGVERLDGSMRWTGAAGTADPSGRPMTARIPYFIASVTKLYVAAAVLRLGEQGRLDLDAPMAAYLPPDLIAGCHRIGGIDRSDRSTVRHLLSHTSGLADYLEDRPKGGLPMIEQLLSEGDRPVPIEEVMRTAREELAPHFPPQDTASPRPRVRYSDTNYQLLMEIIGAVTGGTFAAALDDLILRPLGLTHTWVAGGEPPAGLEPPAALWAGDEVPEVPMALATIRDLNSTLDDQLAFIRALVTGRVFDDPATGGLMGERWNTFGFRLTLMPRTPTWPIQYGLGMMRFHVPRLLSPFSPVPAVVGHSGSTGSWLFHCPERDLLLAGTVDQVTAGAVPYRVVPRLLRLLS